MPTTVTFVQGVRFILFVGAMILLSTRVYSQTGCDCPAVSSCGPCTGGLTQLVLKFDGEGIIIARIILDGNNKTLTSTYDAATKILTINSFVTGQAFGNGSVSIRLIAVLGHVLTDETITTSCDSPIYPGDVFGNLTVLSATSVTGATLCCASADVDPTAPVFTGCPANIIVYTSPGTCTANVSWTAPTATDNCGNVEITSTHNSLGTTFALGTTTVTYTATDDYNNISTCSFTVQVNDNIKPTFNACPTNSNVNVNASCAYSVVDYTGLVTASDNCDNSVTVTQSPAVGTVLSGAGTTQLITLTASDDSGNTNTCTFTITLIDNINPTFTTCPANFNVNVNGSCSYSVIDYTGMAAASDNCDNSVSITQSPLAGTLLSGVGTTQAITLTATDDSGNTSTCIFTITLKDNINPTFTSCPGNINVNMNGSCAYSIADFTALATASDNCDNSVTITQSPAVGTVRSGVGTTQLITLTANDDSGNTSTCTFTITLKDNTKPTFTSCPANFNVNLNGSCSYSIADYTGMATASDNCDNSVTITQSPSIGTILSGIETTQLVTLTATDDSGNSNTCTFTITLKDHVKPTFTSCPANFNVNVNGSCSYSIADFRGMATVFDNCDNSVTISQSPAVGTVLSGVGTTQLITLVASDDSGNNNTCTFTITLKDNTNPTFTSCPADFNVQVDGGGSYSIVNYTGIASTSDNCDNSVTITQSPVVGTIISGVGTTQLITLTATDDSGNTSTCTFTITLEDNVVPSFTSCPVNFNVNLDGTCSYSIEDFTGMATCDNCSNITQSPIAGTVLSGAGTTQLITLSADKGGDPISCTFTITLKDITKPTFTTCPGDVDVNVDGNCSYSVGDYTTMAIASDNCDNSVIITQSPAMGTVLTGTETTQLITLTATDDSGNSNTCTFTITLKDNVDPTFTSCPVDFNVSLNGSCTYSIIDYAPLATADDNCDNSVSITQSPAAGTVFSGAETTQLITLTTTDDSGNSNTCTFMITLKDNTKPVFTTCPGDFDVSVDANCSYSIVDYTGMATVSDNCDNSVVIVQSPAIGTVISGAGATQLITLTASDDSGNAQTCTFTITLKDEIDPTFTSCPGDFNVSVDANCSYSIIDYTEMTIASDNCDHSAAITQFPAVGTILSDVGTTQLMTLTATDDSGNTSTCTFTITLKDNIKPVFTTSPGDLEVNANGSCSYSIIDYTGMATASDNCDNSVTITQSPPNGTVLSGIGITQLITLAATDDSGNASTSTFNITVKDNINPTFSICPGDFDVDVDGSCSYTIVDYTNMVTALDNCDNSVSVTQSPLAGTILSGIGTTQLMTLTASDDTGNTNTCTFTITLKDNIAPTFTTCPGNFDVNIDANCSYSIVDYTGMASASDNCDNSVTITQSPLAGTVLSGMGTTQLITLTATDDSGKTSTCIFTITLKDNIAPIISGCPLDIAVLSSATECGAIVSWTPPALSDNCSATLSCDHNPGELFPVGQTIVTYTATDGNSNTVSCSFSVTVTDDTDPVIAPLADIDVSVDDSGCDATVNWSVPDATDNCAIEEISPDIPSGTRFPIGPTEVTYTAKDVHGNSSTRSFQVNVQDNTSPVIAAMPDIAVKVGSACTSVVTWNDPTVTDNCGVASIVSDIPSGTEFSVGVTLVTYTANDVNGNVSTRNFNVIVEDETLPVISALSDITVSASPETCQAIVSWSSPTATDNCGIESLISTMTSGTAFDTGTTTVTYKATDIHGNTSSESFEIFVQDTDAPVIECMDDIHVITTTACGLNVEWSEPDVKDCSATTVASTHISGSFFQVGTTPVTYTAQDAFGHYSVCTFNVIVEDKTPPTFNNCLTTVTGLAIGTSEATATWMPPDASDNCSVVTVTSSHQTGDSFPIGTTRVTYTAQDSSGNTSICEFDVIVTDGDPITFENCPSDIHVSTTEAAGTVVNWTEPTATSISGAVSITSTNKPGQLFPLGTTEVIYSAEDEGDHKIECRFNVVVSFQEIQYEISKIITPDGDGINDTWIVSNIEKFSDNKVTVVDRWGSIIFSAQGYNNNDVIWKGANQQGDLVPTGTYFFIISVQLGAARVEKSGFIELIR